ncbi:MAG: hypothetical protein RM368_23580 [Nostoc sp. DedSLP03]|uniref:hypothetical protein n=1 Tax=Nostoc sp. DedSLP03 TaxID=3075400 RepID=UPI002AD256FC|nr:hypothetical protein [Nostoc sp. DedSLP03]MDZ7967900.1 hypothetical protein [Nostoc sp. DedSLP03]
MSLRAATEAIEQGPANRAHTAAIEMMNLHESSVTTLTVKVSRGTYLCIGVNLA